MAIAQVESEDACVLVSSSSIELVVAAWECEVQYRPDFVGTRKDFQQNDCRECMNNTIPVRLGQNYLYTCQQPRRLFATLEERRTFCSNGCVLRHVVSVVLGIC